MAENDGSESRDRIMDATYDALIETGYASLTMSDIAAKSGTSTALLHYHFDTKEDLLVAFLDRAIERMTDRFEAARDLEPIARLVELLSMYVLEEDDTDRARFHVALLELRGQAPYKERYRERFRRADALLEAEIADALRAGIEAGEVGEVDPEATAALLIAVVDGARTRAIALGTPGHTGRVLAALYDLVLADRLSAAGRERWTELVAE